MALLTREIERRLAAFRTDLVTAFFLGRATSVSAHLRFRRDVPLNAVISGFEQLTLSASDNVVYLCRQAKL